MDLGKLSKCIITQHIKSSKHIKTSIIELLQNKVKHSTISLFEFLLNGIF